jgi:hypothetical protein
MGRWDYSPSLLNRLSCRVDFTCVSRSPRGRSNGLRLGVITDSLDVLANSDGEFHTTRKRPIAAKVTAGAPHFRYAGAICHRRTTIYRGAGDPEIPPVHHKFCAPGGYG